MPWRSLAPAATPPVPDEEETTMADKPENADQIKGRIKQATGVATGSDDLEREGKKDRAEGKIKSKLDDAKDAVDRARDKLS
jgi:uncharacterized protein YjbJ (UPF0337 family)